MRIHSSLQHNEKKQTHTISNHEQEDKDLKKKKKTPPEKEEWGKKKVTYKGSWIRTTFIFPKMKLNLTVNEAMP